jgi:hypothetical protein
MEVHMKMAETRHPAFHLLAKQSLRFQNAGTDASQRHSCLHKGSHPTRTHQLQSPTSTLPPANDPDPDEYHTVLKKAEDSIVKGPSTHQKPCK